MKLETNIIGENRAVPEEMLVKKQVLFPHFFVVLGVEILSFLNSATAMELLFLARALKSSVSLLFPYFPIIFPHN